MPGLTNADFKRQQEERIQADFAAVPVDIKVNARRAIRWAKDFLMRREGEGHSFHLHHDETFDWSTKPPTRTKTGRIQCSFAKPEWAGDHCSRSMPTGAEAVVMAVCEYTNGA